MRSTHSLFTRIGIQLAVCLALIPLYAGAALEDGLVAHYPLDGDVTDISLTTNSGIANGATPTLDRFGRADHAFAFDGIDDFLQIPHNSSLNMSINGFAVSFFVKVDLNAIGSAFTLFDKIARSSCLTANNGWTLQNALTGASLTFAYADFASFIKLPGPTLIDDDWHHIVVRSSNSQLSFFIDGVNFSTNYLFAKPAGNSAPLLVGKSGCGNDLFFQGALDDIRFYGRALSDDEIMTLYTQVPEQAPIEPEPPVDPEPTIDPGTLRPTANTDLVIQSVTIDPVTGEVTIKATLDSTSSAWAELNSTPDIRLTLEVKPNDGTETLGIAGDSSVPLLTDEQSNKLFYGDITGDTQVEPVVCEAEDERHHHNKHAHHQRGKEHRSPAHGGYDADQWWENKFKQLRERTRNH
jgi:hypothetical protein